MDAAGKGKRVRIYLAERDKAEGSHDPLWQTILDLLREHGADGATVIRCLAGFGAHSRIHIARLADVVPDLPVVVEWVDAPDRVERLLPHVSELVKTGTITCEDVEVVKYTHRSPRPLPPETVGEVMTRGVVAVRPDTPLGETVRMLLLRDYRSLPVVDESNMLVGIVTNNDLVERGGLSARLELLGTLHTAALERELANTEIRGKTAGDVMTREVRSVAADERLDRAAHLMVEHRIKRLPVVDGERHLIGVVSRVDLLRTMGEGYTSPEPPPEPNPDSPRIVGELMRHDLPYVKDAASLGEVLDAVTSTRLNRAIVLDASDRVMGIISDADVLAKLDPGAESGLLPALMRRSSPVAASGAVAHDLMAPSPVTVTAGTPIAEAIDVMLRTRHKVLPVVDTDGRLLGAVDRSDLLRRLQAPSR